MYVYVCVYVCMFKMKGCAIPSGLKCGIRRTPHLWVDHHVIHQHCRRCRQRARLTRRAFDGALRSAADLRTWIIFRCGTWRLKQQQKNK